MPHLGIGVGDAAPADAPSESAIDASPCGSKGSAICPSPPPSYRTDIVPILDAKCNGCHVGGAGPWPLTDHGSGVDWRASIRSDVEGCPMAPADAGAGLSSMERIALLGWLACGAPNNKLFAATQTNEAMQVSVRGQLE